MVFKINTQAFFCFFGDHFFVFFGQVRGDLGKFVGNLALDVL